MDEWIVLFGDHSFDSLDGLLDRGDFGSKYDMKPNHRSNIKFIRRTQNVTKNVGAQLKKMMLKPRGI